MYLEYRCTYTHTCTCNHYSSGYMSYPLAIAHNGSKHAHARFHHPTRQSSNIKFRSPSDTQLTPPHPLSLFFLPFFTTHVPTGSFTHPHFIPLFPSSSLTNRGSNKVSLCHGVKDGIRDVSVVVAEVGEGHCETGSQVVLSSLEAQGHGPYGIIHEGHVLGNTANTGGRGAQLEA